MRTLAAIAVLATALAHAQPADPASLDAELKKFSEVFAKVEAAAADPVDSKQAFFGGAIPGALRKLDPHSIFLDPDQYEQLKQMEKSERKGFGSVVSVLPGRVIILQTVAGAPSAKAGLSPGDEILAINNIPLARLEFEQLIQLLTEARQHQAKLDVRRPGNVRLLQFVLTPELMDSPSVDRAFLLKPGVGYVRVASFEPKTADLFQKEVERLGGSALKGLVIDLRNNPGGVVESALGMAAMFLKAGDKLLSVKGRHARGDEGNGAQGRQTLHLPGGHPDQREDGQCVGDLHRGAAGSQARHGGGRAELWQRPGTERVQPVEQLGRWR